MKRAHDHDLIRQMADGCQSSLSHFYDRHVPFVYAFILRMGNEESQAEQLTMEVFWQVWNRAAQFEIRSMTAQQWLCRILYEQTILKNRHTEWAEHI
jgi:RNA polymerase sigma-70 factor (ECF subfamily)